MPKSFIINYVKNMSISDLERYVEKNGIKASKKDISTVYLYMQKYIDVFFNNPKMYIEKLKGNIEDNSYTLIMSLYEEYKKYL